MGGATLSDDWKDNRFASEWTRNHLRGNPAREEQLRILLALLKGTYRAGEFILDLGCGSGIVEEMIFEEIPDARVVGVDSSQAMLELATARLRRWSTQVQLVQADFGNIENVMLPESSFGTIISVQVLHNVSHVVKRRVFAIAHGLLNPRGVFYILDRIQVDPPELFDQFRLVWKRLETVHQTKIDEGSTYAEHAQLLKEKGDDTATFEEHLSWLRDAGFVAACVHLHGNRALIIARPK
jgi:ubiquinone/menaquinone biosynthesis C-methylase UbiE